MYAVDQVVVVVRTLAGSYVLDLRVDEAAPDVTAELRRHAQATQRLQRLLQPSPSSKHDNTLRDI